MIVTKLRAMLKTFQKQKMLKGDVMIFLFIPGVNNTASTWDKTRTALANSGYESLAVDCPAINDIAELARAIMPSDNKKYILVGHSFGGMVALSMLDQFAERIEGIVLVNSTDGNDSSEAAVIRLQKAQEALTTDYSAFAASATSKAYHPDSLSRQELMQDREKEVASYGAERFAAHQKAMSTRPSSQELFAAFAKPKLVISADNDIVIATSKQKLMAEKAHAEYKEIAKTGHMLPAEEPEKLAEVLAQWSKKYF